MATEVLLMADVKDLGSEGDVVSVADGYARNYLLPQNLAAPVSEATRRRLARLQEQREESQREVKAAAQALADKLAKVSCTIAVKTAEEEHLYGSVTTADISASLAEQGIEIDRHVIVLEHPIKELGCYNVPVTLNANVEGSVKVWVVEE
ncbi:MAG: 50S ribosomal protein L9 [Kiritimatiellia bacterium]|jgi:large subunit ribosomal protein L9|nr:50S ribosomal protein L9 [Kiritimatiellia bacterium]MDP6849147.1 50S ribosomal protein L9 [Kiritimatiellia bacterium]